MAKLFPGLKASGADLNPFAVFRKGPLEVNLGLSCARWVEFGSADAVAVAAYA